MRGRAVPLDSTNDRQHRQQLASATNGLLQFQATSSDFGNVGSPFFHVSTTNYVGGTTYDGSLIGQSGQWLCMGTGPVGSGNYASMFTRQI